MKIYTSLCLGIVIGYFLGILVGVIGYDANICPRNYICSKIIPNTNNGLFKHE